MLNPDPLQGLKYPPPWKAVTLPIEWHGPAHILWTVTTDRGDPADEFDVFEDPDEATARLIAASGDLYSALAELVRLKGLKDSGGPDCLAEHERLKGPAWEAARAALRKATAATAGEDDNTP